MFSSLFHRKPALVRVRLLCGKVSLASSATATQVSADYELPNIEVKPFSAIPGPKPLPVLHNVLEFRKNLSRLHNYIEECSERYGDIFKLEAPGGTNFVYMANPSVLETLLRAEGKYPRRENNLSPNLQWILKKLNFDVPLPFKNGEDWKTARSAANNQIKPSNLHMFADEINNLCSSFIQYVQSTKDANDRISDMNMPVKRLLVASMAKFVYGADLHVFQNPTEETEKFIASIQLIIDSLFKVFVEPPLFKLYPNKVYRDLKEGFTFTNEFGMKFAKEVWKMVEAGEERPVQGLLEQWLREGKMTEREAVMSSNNMFIAGVDTTSGQAVGTLHCIAKHPDAQERLYEEIKTVLGERKQPTPEDLAKMPYLKGCMLESFRIQPANIFVGRVLTKDITLMGYNIPAETNIVYVNSIAAKNKEIFPNPEIFDPERWARDKPHPFAHLLFGHGPRNCYGKRFAELKIKLLLCHVLQKYVLRPEDEALKVEFATVIRPVGDVPMYFKDRE